MNNNCPPSQDSVLHDYKTSCAIKNKGDELILHSFFSPYRIPIGLTDEEILICIALQPLKKAWETKRMEKVKAIFLSLMPEDGPYPPAILAEMHAIDRSQFPMPKELISGVEMTRLRFVIGIRKTVSRLLEKE